LCLSKLEHCSLNQRAVLRGSSDQDAAKSNVGNYVEVSGVFDQQSKTVSIDSLRMLEEGKVMCARPPKEKKQKRQRALASAAGSKTRRKIAST